MDGTTKRLHIRDVIEADLDAFHRLRTDPSVYAFNHFGPETLEETRGWLHDTQMYNNRANRNSHNCAIVLRHTHDVIGWIGFGFASDDVQQVGDIGFGYALLPGYWNQGFATEALQTMIAFVFTTTQAQSVTDECYIGNVASTRVMEKAGLRCIARYFNPDETSANKTETLQYRLTREEWIQAQ